MAWSRVTASSTKRGYGKQHRRLRKALLPQAYGKPCTRCGQTMLPGQLLHLDHTDDRRGYAGFSHADCNVRAGARKARAIQLYRKQAITAHRW